MAWKQTSQSQADGDWLFASPAMVGRLPWYYPQVLRMFDKVPKAAKVWAIPSVGRAVLLIKMVDAGWLGRKADQAFMSTGSLVP